eukprot:gene52756-70526_t
MDVRQTVGRNLRRLRVERGLSQEALAHDAGVAPSFVSQIENGLRSPTVTLLQDLADALKTPIVEFFAEGQPVPPQLPREKFNAHQAQQNFSQANTDSPEQLSRDSVAHDPSALEIRQNGKTHYGSRLSPLLSPSDTRAPRGTQHAWRLLPILDLRDDTEELRQKICLSVLIMNVGAF